MSATDSFGTLSTFADVARQLVPVTGLIHVAAGNGIGETSKWHDWPVEHALLIDADASRIKWADENQAKNSGWLAVAATLSDSDKNADFHAVSNPAESGLVNPGLLRPIWPNLHSVGVRRVPTTRLDTLLDNVDSDIGQRANWIIIDCFPALKILQGAGHYIERWSVLWVRAILDDRCSEVPGVTVQEIEEFLGPFGYFAVTRIESNHPAVGHVLFVRNWPAWFTPKLEKQTQQLVDASRSGADLGVRLDAAVSERLQLAESNKVLQEQVAQMESDLRSARKDLTEGRVLLESRERSLDDLKSKFGGEVQARSALLEAKEQLGARVAALEGDRKRMVASHEALQLHLAQSRTELQEMQTSFAEARGALRGHETAAEEQRARLDDKVSELVSITDSKRELERRIESLQAERSAIELTRDQMQRAHADLRSQIEEQLRAAETELTQARDAADAIQNELDQGRRSMQEIELRLSEAQKQAQAQTKTINDLKGQVAQLGNEKVAITQQKGELEKRIKVLEGERTAAASSRENIQRELKETQSRLEVALKSVNEAETRAKTHENREQDMRKQLDQVRSSLQEKTGLVATLEAQLADTSQRQRVLREEMVKAEAQIDLIKDVLLREPGI